MKTWHLLPLVIFIGIAGYQFGYYRAKLADSPSVQVPQDTLSDNSIEALDEALTAVPVVASASAARPADRAPVASYSGSAPLQIQAVADTVRRIRQANPDASQIRVPLSEDGSEWLTTGEADLTTRGRLARYFADHASAGQVAFHAMHCEQTRCLLIGESDGDSEQWGKLLGGLKEQPDWRQATIKTYTSQHNQHTYFLTELRR
ncbi:hypothetical protein OCL06_08420 [Alteromonas sp. ASW11-19]|uniref:Uncharacterized protein n=1 Tax=Alteromonas salexigens TaxID=2982530 RepID=A0ABT2VMU7_9ALTE|nr:hypothetical protein [Alteromonas salexigens]MCU7554622.1 hypothetical protein [Alteromonas salexigens]